MTAIATHQIPTTSIDRALLRAASGLDRIVAGRMERRVASAAPAAASQHDASRTTAQALGAIGILPR